LGVACFLETARGAPNEGAEIRFTEKKVSLRIGTQSNGQGHETAYPQIAGDLLGLPMEAFEYIQADTQEVIAGNGHGGARSMHMGGAALHRAIQEVLRKGTTVAARLLQANENAITFADGRFAIRSVPERSVDLLSVARAARDANIATDDSGSGLDTYVWNLLDVITFPNGCHIAELEVDPETGTIELLRYLAVDDFGAVINPVLTIGQVQGGVAQGIGQALLENTVYDPASGQLLSGSLLDYALPRANDLPDLEIVLSGVPTAANPFGVKGAGQAGAIAAPQTIVCAVLDALAPLGVTHIDMPLTPERVWRALRSARG
jgi:carbon-monoxide dehydrogenase large subunit